MYLYRDTEKKEGDLAKVIPPSMVRIALTGVNILQRKFSLKWKSQLSFTSWASWSIALASLHIMIDQLKKVLESINHFLHYELTRGHKGTHTNEDAPSGLPTDD